MKIIQFIILFFNIVINFLSAQENIEHWEEIISITRKSNISLNQKEEVAQKVLKYFRTSFENEMVGASGPSLYEKVLANPDLVSALAEKNGKFKNLFTQFSQFIKQLVVERKLQACDSFLKLKDNILIGAGNYSACNEKSFAHTYVNWKKTAQGAIDQQVYSVPLFAYTENVNDLLQISSVLEIKANMEERAPLVPSGLKIKNNNPSFVPYDVAETYNKLLLRERTYTRSMLNAVRNIVSLELQYGKELPNLKSLQGKIASNITKYCKYCNEKTKKSLNLKLQSILESDLQSGKIAYSPSYQVVSNLCQNLKAAKYPFHENYSVRDLSPLSLLAGKGKAKSNIYEDKRILALSAVIKQGGSGLLLLTESLTNLDDKVPERLKLKCNGSKADEDLIFQAGQEAQEKATEYLVKMNEQITLSTDNQEIEKDLSWMLKTNPKSFGEALVNDPEISEVTCGLISRLKVEDEREKLNDQAIIWGSAIVGGALTLTGVLAPAGTALTMGALALGSTTGIIAGVYNTIEANEALEQSELFEASTFATGDTDQALISQQEYERYQSNKISAILNFGLSSVDFALITKQALRSGKTLAQINDFHDEALKQNNVKIFEEVVGNNSLAEVKKQLENVHQHITSVDFLQTAQFKPKGRMILIEDLSENAKKHVPYYKNWVGDVLLEGVESSKAIRLERIPMEKNLGLQIESISLSTPNGTYIGKIPCVKQVNDCLKGVNGQDLYNIPIDNNYLVVIKQKNGEEVVINTSLLKSENDLPSGYRFALDQKNYLDNGFSGGHTPETFEKYLNTYNDRIQIVEDKTTEFSFKFIGNEKEFKIKQVYTSIDGTNKKKCKTIFMGGETDLKEIEDILAPKLIGKFENNELISEQVITSSGMKINLMIPTHRGNIKTLTLEEVTH